MPTEFFWMVPQFRLSGFQMSGILKLLSLSVAGWFESFDAVLGVHVLRVDRWTHDHTLTLRAGTASAETQIERTDFPRFRIGLKRSAIRNIKIGWNPRCTFQFRRFWSWHLGQLLDMPGSVMQFLLYLKALFQ
jgi:hypothetical protein